MKRVGEWWVTDSMTSAANHFARSSVIELALAHLPAHRRDTVAQAGGHIGIWPKKLAEHFERVCTWEPTPDNMVCLRANVEDCTNVFAIQGCLGDRLTDVEMSLSVRNSGKHCVRRGGTHDLDVGMDKLDSAVSSRLDALFLDVEGYEYFALLGAEGLIKRDLPLVVLEQNGLSAKYGRSDEDLKKFLGKYGYVVAEMFDADVIYVQKDWP